MFLAIFVYAWRKSKGGAFDDDFQWWLREPLLAARDPDGEDRPCMMSVHNARTLGEVQFHVDGSTLIAKARSRALTKFLASTEEVMFMVDEDVEAPREAFQVLLTHVERTKGIALGVCALSDTGGPNCWRKNGQTVGGVSFAAIHKNAAKAVAMRLANVVDVDGRPLVPAFAEILKGTEWYGEDVSFCLRAHQASIPVDAFLLSGLKHDGREVDLAASVDPVWGCWT
jgi:hypothetical protein